MKQEPRYFGLTALGRHLFGFEKNVDGRRAHWMKLPLDFFNNPTVLSLPDSQRLPLIGVGLLCIRRDNSVLFDVGSVRRALSLRTAPDLNLYMAEGLIELHATSKTGDSVRGEEREERSKREGEETGPPAYAFRAEKAIFDSRAQAETKLLRTVAILAEKLGRDPPSVMVEVTSYRKPDGTVVKGRENPGQLGSVERVKKSLEDAEGWLADLDKKATG